MDADQNFFALCRTKDGLAVKRLQLTADVQRKLVALFEVQRTAFFEGISEEVAFSGDWKPDEDELLTIDLPQEANILIETINGNPLARPILDSGDFAQEGIRAIFTGVMEDGIAKVWMQRFSPQQILSRRFSLLLDQNTFKELTGPAFSLDTRLVCVIEDRIMKFKSFHNLRMIFDLSRYFREATDDDIDHFAGHAVLRILDLQRFKNLADQTTRKLIHAVQYSGVLDKHAAKKIQTKARKMGLQLEVIDNAVVIPADKREIKKLLKFLHDDLYEAPLSGARYVTNSKRLA